MKVLLVSNEYSKPNRIGNPIIYRLQDALKSCKSVDSVVFVPFKNSVASFRDIRIAAKQADVIHIQFGGLYALLIWFSLIGVKKPKLLTFHGTDIHAKEILTTKSKGTKLKIWLSQKASFCSIILFDKLGFVSNTLLYYIPSFILKKYRKKFFIQPLGVDYKNFVPFPKEKACSILDISMGKYALFSDKSGTILKRRDIAEAIVKTIGEDYKLLVMCGVKPDLVPVYINACDFVLLTSDEEGSPNITREALALNKRVFSVDVGDVKQQLAGLHNSSLISRNPTEAAKTIKQKLSEEYIDNSRFSLQNKIDFTMIAIKLVSVYKESITEREIKKRIKLRFCEKINDSKN